MLEGFKLAVLEPVCILEYLGRLPSVGGGEQSVGEPAVTPKRQQAAVAVVR